MMDKSPLSTEDKALLQIAFDEAGDPFHAGKRAVACALRTKDGSVYKGIVVETDVSSLTVCAEPIAIGAMLVDKKDEIETIVAVHYDPDTDKHTVYPPCGRCREFVIDYGPDARVIISEAGTDELFAVASRDLIPFKCGTYKDNGFVR